MLNSIPTGEDLSDIDKQVLFRSSRNADTFTGDRAFLTLAPRVVNDEFVKKGLKHVMRDYKAYGIKEFISFESFLELDTYEYELMINTSKELIEDEEKIREEMKKARVNEK